MFASETIVAEFPARTISIIVPFAAAGGNDVQARLVAKGLSERLGRPVVVENRPGAGGHIAAALVARAKPDGHTLLFCSTGTLVFAAVVKAPEVGRSLEEQGIFVLGESPVPFTRRVQADVVSITKVVKAINLHLEE